MTWATIEEKFQQTLAHLYDKDEIRQLFLITIDSIADISANKYILVKNDGVNENLFDRTENIIQELRSGKPLQHILGESYFYGKVFEVSADTLIPRPETEELVHMIIQDHKDRENLQIIDIGTGTGCIPISLYMNLPNNKVYALDISKEALHVAQRNAQRLQAPIQFMNADILEWDLFFDDALKFDIIVSNPPYITPKEKEQMHQNVLNFEPHLALFIEEDTPLLFYDYIADFAKKHLKPNGLLYFEINQYLSKETADLLRKKGYSEVEVYQDINQSDRMIRAKI